MPALDIPSAQAPPERRRLRAFSIEYLIAWHVPDAKLGYTASTPSCKTTFQRRLGTVAWLHVATELRKRRDRIRQKPNTPNILHFVGRLEVKQKGWMVT